MSYHLSEEKCGSCGLCCEQIPKLYLFPEEIPNIQQLAVETQKRIVLKLEDVVLEKKNQEILILRYSMEKTSEKALCPFYLETSKQCEIFDNRPMICKALPIFGSIDSGDSAAISILGKCRTEYSVEGLDLLKTQFPSQFEELQNYFTRYHQSLSYLEQITTSGEIELDEGKDPASIQDKIRDWKKIDLKPNGV